MNRETAQDLWNFALERYGATGVAPACLQLQDDFGVDVCLLLCTLWCAEHGCALDPARLAQLDAQCAPWRCRVVQPLRQQRRAWRGDASRERDYEDLKRLELQAERLQLERLAALAGWPGGGAGELAPAVLRRRNLRVLGRHYGLGEDVLEPVAALFDSAASG